MLILHDFFSKTNRFTNLYAKSLRKKNLGPNSWLKLVFGLMNPPKEGIFTNIGKYFAETLQIEDLAVKNVFLFYYVDFFVKKIPNLYQKHFLWMWKKNLKHFVEKSLSVFEGPPLSPSNTLWLFSAKCFKFFFKHS